MVSKFEMRIRLSIRPIPFGRGSGGAGHELRVPGALRAAVARRPRGRGGGAHAVRARPPRAAARRPRAAAPHQ